MCIFEYVYFARPDSILEGQVVHHVRQQLGRQLAKEAPVDADVVVGVPDSATPAAIGYSAESGLPFTEGLIKNRYIGRTFIQPDDALRREGVRIKYNPLEANLRGKRVVSDRRLHCARQHGRAAGAAYPRGWRQGSPRARLFATGPLPVLHGH